MTKAQRQRMKQLQEESWQHKHLLPIRRKRRKKPELASPAAQTYPRIRRKGVRQRSLPLALDPRWSREQTLTNQDGLELVRKLLTTKGINVRKKD